jgi:putative sterol carrier protein
MAHENSKGYFAYLPSTLTAEKAKSINAIYQFDVDGGGTWVVDLTKDADWVSEGPSAASQCTISISEANFVDLVNGKLPSTAAFMQGKLKIKGNMGLAMKLANVLK